MLRFDLLLERLETLAAEDAAAHDRPSSVEERTRIHTELIDARAEMAELCDQLRLDRPKVSGRDSRSRRYEPT